MKKATSVLIGLLVCSPSIFSQVGNYLNGNGTVVDVKTANDQTWTIRKHVQELQLGEFAKDSNLEIHSDYSMSGGTIGQLKVGDFISVTQVAEASVSDEYESWLKISTDSGLSGWIFLGSYSYEYAQFRDPYFKNRWEVTGFLQTNRKWTTRRMFYQHVAVWEVLNIRDRPGLQGSKVISRIVPPKNNNPQVNLDVMEVTEETETIDGKNDRWLKIQYNGTIGWIFGGYASVERGGYKYYTPENIILSTLGGF